MRKSALNSINIPGIGCLFPVPLLYFSEFIILRFSFRCNFNLRRSKSRNLNCYLCDSWEKGCENKSFLGWLNVGQFWVSEDCDFWVTLCWKIFKKFSVLDVYWLCDSLKRSFPCMCPYLIAKIFKMPECRSQNWVQIYVREVIFKALF